MSKSAQQPKTSRQPSQDEQEKVWAAFDPEMLKHLCTTWDFSDYATEYTLPGKDRFYWYQDNGSDILAVAHLDSVQDDGTCQVVYTSAGPLAVSGALDDRLGVYVILDLLPALGVTCDWLLTTDEEMGRSTAEEFAEDFLTDHVPSKQYNWIIQFDRGGTDVVMYDYETPELCDLVEQSGARVGQGSFSDICMLEDLGCVGINWGVGYADYHSPRAHAWLSDTFRMVARFLRFHAANHDVFLPHTPHRHKAVDVKWWENYDVFDRNDVIDWVEADCGHDIDLDDEDSYKEWGTDYVVCSDCADVA